MFTLLCVVILILMWDYKKWWFSFCRFSKILRDLFFFEWLSRFNILLFKLTVHNSRNIFKLKFIFQFFPYSTGRFPNNGDQLVLCWPRQDFELPVDISNYFKLGTTKAIPLSTRKPNKACHSKNGCSLEKININWIDPIWFLPYQNST